MLKVLAFVIACAFISVAESQEPNSPRAKKQVHQDKNGTEQSPLVVKVIPPERPKEETDRDNEKFRIDRDMRDFTRDLRDYGRTATAISWLLLLIAAAQAGFFLYQLRLMRSQLLDAKRSADAAERASNAALAQGRTMETAERAWVSYGQVNMGTFSNATHTSTGATGQSGFMFRMVWLNGGRTPAIHCGIETGISVVYPPYGETPPHFDFGAITGTRETILIPNHPVTGTPAYLIGKDRDAFVARKCRVFFFGRAEYQDLINLGVKHHTEVTLEVIYDGQRDDGHPNIVYSIFGPQNTVA